ncbi:MAG: adaptor protein MecA [Firmicutes bacterium]|nr:adaptor protein MecA [Bacillota bacterium]
METIRISESKIKVMLSREDMTKYRIPRASADGSDPSLRAATSADGSDPSLRAAIRSILRDAGRAGGFDPDSGQLYIQLYPDKRGGCELFVTKTDDDAEGRGKAAPKACDVSTGAARTCAVRMEIFSFPSLDGLISFADRIFPSFCGESAAYTDGKAYFLTLACGDLSELFALLCAFADEYGGALEGFGKDLYIAEYCRRITPDGKRDAIALLSSLR